MVSAHPIGELLTEAGLISEGQLQTALYDQQVYQDMRLGEILALRGWLQQQTADFFNEVFQDSSPEKKIKTRLGDYFKQAALISPEQVDSIVKEQELNHVRFGSITVLKGYISQKTLDFFLKYLAAEQSKSSGFWQGNRHKAKETFSQHDNKTLMQKETMHHAKNTVGGVATLSKEQVAATHNGTVKDVEIHWI